MQKPGHLINEEEYFDLIFRKTACLFQVSMQLGAAVTPNHGFGPHDDIEAQLGEYGRNLGLAFQIVDDVLDLTATEEVLGKPVASDLREGKATLAVIHALERGTGADREAIRTVLADRSFDRVSHPQIIEILRRHGSIDYAMDTACAYAEAARLRIADLLRLRSQARPTLGPRLRHRLHRCFSFVNFPSHFPCSLSLVVPASVSSQVNVHADRILVVKSQHILTLLANGKAIKTYQILLLAKVRAIPNRGRAIMRLLKGCTSSTAEMRIAASTAPCISRTRMSKIKRARKSRRGSIRRSDHDPWNPERPMVGIASA